MKPKWIEVKDYLEEQLKRDDIEEEHRVSIKGTLSFLEHDNNKSKDEWKSFIKRMETKVKEWNKEFPVNGCEIRTEIYNSTGLRAFSLNLEGSSFFSWLVNIDSFLRPHNEMYISTIQLGSDGTPVSSFEEIETYINNMFKSKNFQELVRYAESEN